ncbi:MAG: 5-formyltetrahydrofolate cyclo-ligase [Hyphomicrobiales bacterium]|nr:MAG: 5-formyltetrahydrofolate cyclo-ligase [Hyphomicrobiales bacterium]
MDRDNEASPAIGEYASPPCFMHELSPDFQPKPERTGAWGDVARWRKAERQRLIDARLAMSAQERAGRAERIAAGLDRAIGRVSGRIVSAYWPFRGEPDLRNWTIRVIERGGRIALPVVIRKGWPLEFRIWAPGDPLERGVWNILVPSRGPAVEPDIVVAPVVGFDAANYRLGYGGGFYDRTLAAMTRRPLALGVGYETARIATIYPQPHDIALSAVVTDA